MRNFQWTEPLFPKIYSVVPAGPFCTCCQPRHYRPFILKGFAFRYDSVRSYLRFLSNSAASSSTGLWIFGPQVFVGVYPPSCRFSFFVFVDLWNLPSRLEFTILSSVSLLLPFSSEEEEPLDLRLVFPFLDFNISAGGYIVNIFHL